MAALEMSRLEREISRGVSTQVGVILLAGPPWRRGPPTWPQLGKN
jgi:hypothetical protein